MKHPKIIDYKLLILLFLGSQVLGLFGILLINQNNVNLINNKQRPTSYSSFDQQLLFHPGQTRLNQAITADKEISSVVKSTQLSAEDSSHQGAAVVESSFVDETSDISDSSKSHKTNPQNQPSKPVEQEFESSLLRDIKPNYGSDINHHPVEPRT